MNAQTNDLNGFEEVYRNHVSLVQAGDLKGVMADMDPASLATVFEGVNVPRGEVTSARVVGANLDGERAVGEAIYSTPDGDIALRSGWRHDGARWLADSLENFADDPHQS